MAISKSTLTKDLLAKLMRGIAKTTIAPVTDGSVTFSSSTFSNAGYIYSIEDSLSIDWSDPSITEVRVDQGLQTIAMDVEKGDITFSANYPTVAAAAVSEFFKTTTGSVSITSNESVAYTGVGISTEPKTTEVSVLIEDMNEEYSIAFARVSLTARLSYDNDTKVWYIGLSGRVLTNLASGQPDAVVCEKVTTP